MKNCWNKWWNGLIGLLVGWSWLLSVRAAAPVEFSLSEGVVVLQDASASVAVQLRSVRFNRGSGQWNADLVLSNRGPARVVSPLVVRLEDNGGLVLPPPGFVGAADGKAFLEVIPASGPTLNPGAMTAPRTLVLGATPLPPAIRLVPYAGPVANPVAGAAALIRTLNEVGQPLPGVQVRESSSGGIRELVSDARFGLVTLGPGAVEYQIRAERTGDDATATLPIWARIRVRTNGVILAPLPVLTPRSRTERGIFGAPDAGFQTRDGALRLRGVSAASVGLTSLGAQALPAALPTGWSPLRAGVVELGTEPLTDGRLTVSMPAGTTLASTETVRLVRWEESTFEWRALAAVPGRGADALEFPLARSGVYAVVVADQSPTAPPAPGVNTALAGSAVVIPAGTGLVATGRVTPGSSPASVQPELVTALAEVTFTNPAGALPSGTVLLCDITEEYRLRDGTRRVTPRYEKFVTGYQRPGTPLAGTLTATFPLRPLLLFPGEELAEAVVRVDVLPDDALAGQLLAEAGGFATAGNVRITAVPGDFVADQGVLLREYPAAAFAEVPTGGLPVATVFELGVGTLADGHRLTLQTGAAGTNETLVLARTVYAAGRFGLQPVERLTSDATGRLVGREPGAGERLAGIDGAGQYVLLRTKTATGLVTGVVRDRSGRPASGLLVQSGPWLAVSDTGGRYRLLGAPGEVVLTVNDPLTGDTATERRPLASTGESLVVDLATGIRGPAIISTSPTNNALNVSRVTAVSVLFNKPLAPGPVAAPGAVQLLTATGSNVPVSITLNLARMALTILPSAPLPGSERLTVRLAAALTDPTGAPLEGVREFSFTTETDVIRRADSILVIREPINGQAPMIGGSGVAEPNLPVILVNDTTGITSTVLANADGSFSNSIPAEVDDELAVVVVNRNGSRNRVTPSQQLFADGSVGLFAGGGTIRAAGEGGDFVIDLPSGAIPRKTIFAVTPVAMSLATNQLPVPALGQRIAAAIDVRISGDRPSGFAGLSVPFDPVAFGVPSDQSPTNLTYTLAIARLVDGEPAYQVVDEMEFRAGRLVARAQAPFSGWLDGQGLDPNPALEFSASGRPARNARPASLILFALQGAEIFRMVILAAFDPALRLTGKAGLCLRTTEAGCLEESLDALFSVGNAGVGLFSAFDLVGDITASQLSAVASASRVPVAGAIIDAVPVATGGGPVKVGRGAPYAVTDRGGQYGLMLPRSRDVYLARASHPSTAEPVRQPVAPVLEAEFASPTVRKNFTFLAQRGLLLPPQVSINQRPLFPGTNELATVFVDVVHPLAASARIASTTLFVSSLPGETNTPVPVLADVEKTEPVPVPGIGGRGQKRFKLTLRATRALRADLRVRASVTLGDRTIEEVARWLVDFGATPSGRNLPIQSDPLDKIGPSLVQVFPLAGGTLPAGEPIRLIFSEPVDASITNTPGAFQLTPAVAGGLTLRLTEAQTVLEILPPALVAGTQYTLTLQAPVRDLAGNPLDNAGTVGMNVTVRFSTPAVRSFPLPGIGSGGGAVAHDNSIFVLDRAGAGRLVVFDAGNPAQPAQVAAVDLPGFPRDLEFVPNWSYFLRPPELFPGEPARTNRNLLLIVGGLTGTRDTFNTNPDFQRQYLRVYDVTQPSNPVRIASTELTRRPSTVPKVTWHPPQVAFFENEADFQQVAVLDLQAFINAYNLGLDERTSFGSRQGFIPGIDGSGRRPDGTTNSTPNGQYTDRDDTLPRWEKEPVDFFGRVFGFSLQPEDGKRRILDYAYDQREGVGALVFSGGPKLTVNGNPTGEQLPPGFRVAWFGGQPVLAPSATFPLGDGARPKRVHVELGVNLGSDDAPDFRNLACISLAPDADGTPKLLVLDISDALAPRELSRIPLPTELGLPQSIFRLPDGKLALAMTTDALVFDPRQVLAPAPAAGLHPSFRSRLPAAGGGNQTLTVSRVGLLATSLGGQNAVVQLEPTLRFVQFRPDSALAADPRTAVLVGTAVPQASEIRNNSAKAAALMSALDVVTAIHPTSVNGRSATMPALIPPTRNGHSYVLLEAPGGAGREIRLGLQALDVAGLPLRNKGRDFPPVRAVSFETSSILAQPARAAVDAPVIPLVATRLSDDPSSALYNTYLSQPFAVVVEAVPLLKLEQIQAALPRIVLWSGHQLSAFIDPDMNLNAVLGPFAARIVPIGNGGGEAMIVPRTSATAETFPGTYIPGSKPPPPNAHESLPGTFGLVNAFNGEIRAETVDISLPGRGMPIVFERVLGGQDLYQGRFGRGWDFTYNQSIIALRPTTFGLSRQLTFLIETLTDTTGGVTPFARTGDLVFADGAGHLIPYAYAGNTPPPEVASDPLVEQLGWKGRTVAFYLPSTNTSGVFDPIFEFPDGAYARLTPEGRQYWYDRFGRISKIYDRHTANFQELQYGFRGLVTRIIDRSIPDGARFLEIGYYVAEGDSELAGGLNVVTDNNSAFGKIARLRDYTGRIVDFEYDGDLLVRRLGIAGNGANEGSSQRPVVTYNWDGSADNLNGVVAGGDPSQQDAALFSATVDRDAKQVAGTGNGIGGLVSMDFPSSGGSKVTGPDQAVTEFKFDSRGYATERHESGPGNDPTRNIYKYDRNGLLTNMVETLGAETSYVYDSENASLRARKNLLRTERRPGPRGGPVQIVTTPKYELRFNLLTDDLTDANGHRHTYHLTPDGTEVERIVHVGAGETQYRYNEFGQLLGVTSPDGIQSGHEYDPITGFATAELRGGNRYRLGYDSTTAAKHGRPTTITPPTGAATTLVYDERLLPTEIRRGQSVLKLGYDANGNTVYQEEAVNALSRRVERQVFNRLNFLESTTTDGVDVNGVAMKLTTKFGSSAADAWRVRSITYPGGQVRKFDYDHLGFVREIALGKYVEKIKRDVHGNVLEFRQGEQLVRKYGYDGHDRLTNSISLGQVGEESVTKSYFPGGELAQVIVADAKFGELQRLSVETIDALGRPKKQTQKGSLNDAVTSFEYPADPAGGATITDGPRERVEARHDSAGYPRSLNHTLAQVTLTPDGNGNITGTSSVEGTRTYRSTSGFDELDHVFRLEDDLGLHTTLEPRLDGSPEGIIDGRGKRTRQEFSVLGELLQQVRPNRVEFNFRQDKNRQPILAADAALKGQEHAYDTGTFRPTEFRLRSTQSFLFEQPNDLNLAEKIFTPGGATDLKYDLQGRIKARDASYTQGESYKMEVEHDGLGRPRSVTYGPGGEYTALFDYDLLGPLTTAAYTESQGKFTVANTLYADGNRATVRYPSGLVLTEERDLGGRLIAVQAGGADAFRVLRHVGVGERGEVSVGNGVLFETNRFDLRRRIVARSYGRAANGAALADVRYRYDAADNVVARQELHRHGRADVYEYDDGNRLQRADLGLRLDLKDAVRHSATGLKEPLGFKAGRYARVYNYDTRGFDLLERVETINPNPLTVAPIPFVQSLENPDASLFPLKLDGVDRGAPDPLGNTISTRLFVPVAGGGRQRVAAQLKYSALSQLVRVERADGVVVAYEHQPNGLIHRRLAIGPGFTNDVAYVWDEGRLIEEYERSGSTNRLRARYLYADEDSPFAADLADTSGQLKRHWYLRDALGSVMAVANASGEVVERVQYDPWGQPVVEGRDIRPPQVALVAASVNGQFILQFSEAIFPPLRATAAAELPGADGALFTAGRELPTDAIKLVTTGGLVSTELVYEDDLPTGFAFGQILRVKPQPTIATIIGLQIGGAFLTDEWGNPNIAETLTFRVPATGPVLYEAPLAQQDTRAPVLERSAVGSSMLFHGQVFDVDVGLIYLRARFYDTSTGMFLQQDPLGYEDSPNSYAGFANNPTTQRDPTGMSTLPPVHPPKMVKPMGLGGRLPHELLPPGTRLKTMGIGRNGTAASARGAGETTEVLSRSVRRSDASAGSVDSIHSRPPPLRALSAEQLETARVRGNYEIKNLTDFKEKALSSGRLQVTYEDIGHVDVSDGLFVKGTLGHHRYDPATGNSTVTINSRAQAAALASPMGSPLRKQLQLTELHELSHAQNALGVGRRAAYGRENFLEELGVHASEADMEIAIFGVGSSLKTHNRRSFERGGWEGIANYMLNSEKYRRQFQISTRAQAVGLLQQYGYHVRVEPRTGWGY